MPAFVAYEVPLHPSSTPGPSTPTPQPPTPTPDPTATPVPEDPLSLEEKIGQMLLVGFRGLTVNDDSPIVQDIRQRNLGGVVLFDYDVPNRSPNRNIQSPEQLRALTAALQAAASTPLLVAVDYEGGMVNRLKEKYGFPPTVSHQFLGQADDLELTRRYTRTMAETLAEVGINLNLAPVVDLNTNPDNPIIARFQRSFSADPEVVTRHARVFIQSHHEKGILCTPKHFPGHGSSSTDSHKGLADVTETWSPSELEPYQQLNQEGLVDVIMTAHVYNAHLDPGYPATLSKKIIAGLLRQEIGYDGVVITDDLQMGAISRYYGFDEAVVLAVEAGVDILAIANNSVYEEGAAARAMSLIKQAVEAGRISPERIDESYQRIQRLKSRLQRA